MAELLLDALLELLYWIFQTIFIFILTQYETLLPMMKQMSDERRKYNEIFIIPCVYTYNTKYTSCLYRILKLSSPPLTFSEFRWEHFYRFQSFQSFTLTELHFFSKRVVLPDTTYFPTRQFIDLIAPLKIRWLICLSIFSVNVRSPEKCLKLKGDPNTCFDQSTEHCKFVQNKDKNVSKLNQVILQPLKNWNRYFRVRWVFISDRIRS